MRIVEINLGVGLMITFDDMEEEDVKKFKQFGVVIINIINRDIIPEKVSVLHLATFYSKKDVSLIEACNYNDHLEKLKECEWVIEVIAERLDWKKDLYKKISPFIDKQILTSNTSGISLEELSSEMDDNVKKNFFITHFFNPPRYMKLVEFIYTDLNSSDMIKEMADFMENKLGKGVVYAKDTPNFIANRIGVFGMMVTVNEAIKNKINIEADLASKSAINKLEKIGGSIQIKK